MSQIYFYALPEDWPFALSEVEQAASLQVVLAGRSASPTLCPVPSLIEVPKLGEADEPQTLACASYLISPADGPIKVRELKTPTGAAFFVDQLANPDAIAFTPAGRWDENIIIAGTVGAAHDTPKAKALLRLFSRALSKSFRRVKGIWLGESALAKWKTGCRLTAAVQSPAEYDLRESPMSASGQCGANRKFFRMTAAP